MKYFTSLVAIAMAMGLASVSAEAQSRGGSSSSSSRSSPSSSSSYGRSSPSSSSSSSYSRPSSSSSSSSYSRPSSSSSSTQSHPSSGSSYGGGSSSSSSKSYGSSSSPQQSRPSSGSTYGGGSSNSNSSSKSYGNSSSSQQSRPNTDSHYGSSGNTSGRSNYGGGSNNSYNSGANKYGGGSNRSTTSGEYGTAKYGKSTYSNYNGGYNSQRYSQTLASNRSYGQLRYNNVMHNYSPYVNNRYTYVNNYYGYGSHPWGYWGYSNYWGSPYGSYGYYSGFYSGLFWGSMFVPPCYGCAYGYYVTPGYWNSWGAYGYRPAFYYPYSPIALTADLLAYGLINWIYATDYQQARYQNYSYGQQDQQFYQSSLNTQVSHPFTYSQVYLPTKPFTDIAQDLSGVQDARVVNNFMTGLTRMTQLLEQRIGQVMPGFTFQKNEIDIRGGENIGNVLVSLDGQITRNDQNRQPIVSQVFKGLINLQTGSVEIFAPLAQPGSQVAVPNPQDIATLQQINKEIDAVRAQLADSPQAQQQGPQQQLQNGGQSKSGW